MTKANYYCEIFDKENLQEIERKNAKYRIIQDDEKTFYAEVFRGFKDDEINNSKTRNFFIWLIGSSFVDNKYKEITVYKWSTIPNNKADELYRSGLGISIPDSKFSTYDEALQAIEDYKKYPIITEIK